MQKFTLRRRYFPHATFSTLHRKDGSQVCVMVEKPWLDNKASQSCVPEGKYTIKPHKSPKFGDCYILESGRLGVGLPPNLRTYILIHIANKASELEGCLATGEKFGVLDGEWCVLNSRIAFNALMQELGGKKAQLKIVKD